MSWILIGGVGGRFSQAFGKSVLISMHSTIEGSCARARVEERGILFLDFFGEVSVDPPRFADTAFMTG